MADRLPSYEASLHVTFASSQNCRCPLPHRQVAHATPEDEFTVVVLFSGALLPLGSHRNPLHTHFLLKADSPSMLHSIAQIAALHHMNKSAPFILNRSSSPNEIHVPKEVGTRQHPEIAPSESTSLSTESNQINRLPRSLPLAL